MTFVGRSCELAFLAAELEAAEAGRSRLVLIQGPAGIGKSLLLRHFVSSTAGAVVWAAGHEAEAGLASGLVTRLLSAAGQFEPIEGSPSDATQESTALGPALLSRLRDLGTRSPVVMVIDDLQWADSDSVAALVFALRRLSPEPVLSILVAREACSVPSLLRRIVSDEGRSLVIPGLTLRDLRRLLTELGAPPLSRLCLERIHEHTLGHPAYARSLYEELGPDRLWRSESPLPAPKELSHDVRQRMASCSEATIRLLAGCAVLGVQAPLPLAVRVAATEDVAATLQEAEDARLLERIESRTQREVRFPHPLVRSAIYHDLALPLRSDLHLRAARWVGPEASLAHRAAATLNDDALWMELAALAGAEASAGSYLDAAGHLLVAARLASDRKTHEQLLLHALSLYQRAGEAAEVSPWTTEIAGFEESSTQQLVLGHQAMLEGDSGEAERRLERGVALSRADNDRRCRIGCQLLLAQVCAMNLRLAEAIDWARAAQDLCESPSETAQTCSVRATCLGASGQAVEGLALVDSSPSPRECAAHELIVVMSRGLLRLWTDDLHGAREDLSGLQGLGFGRSALPVSVLSLAWLADVEYRLGRWAESMSHADRALELSADSGLRWLEPFVLAAATSARAASGHWEAARHHVDAALAAAARNGDLGSRLLASTAAANLAWAMGDPLAVVDAVEDLDSIADEEVQEPAVYPWRDLFADALITLGRLDEAERVLEVVETMARRCCRQSSLARVARLRGRIAFSRRNDSAAVDAFEEASELAALVPAPFERALIDDAYGRFLRRAGQRKSAAARLGAAHNTFRALGADPFVRRTEAEIAGCGLRSKSQATGVQSILTPQELSVAGLVVSGLLNRQVAAELVVSVKTVEYHLGNIYAKLGIESRRQLADRLRQN